MKTEYKNGDISSRVTHFNAEEQFLKACSDDGICFYDLKLISEHLLEQKKREDDLKDVIISIPRLTTSFKQDVSTSYN